MNKIDFFPSILGAEESNSMAKQLVLLIVNSKSADETLLLAKTELEKSNTHLTEVLNAQKTNPYTEALKDLDLFRDETHVGGRDVIKAMTHWVFDKKVQEAALRLKKIFERHGWSLQRFSYQKQSSATNSLTTELKQEQNQADLATCSLMDWYEAEIKSQSGFEEVFNKKTGHESQKESIAKRDAQLVVNEDLENLITFLNSMIAFKKDDTAWNTIFKEVEAIVKQFNTTARSRRSSKGGNTLPEE